MRRFAAVAALLIALPAIGRAADDKTSAANLAPLTLEGDTASAKEVNLELGQSRLLRVSMPVSRVSIADPSVADVAVYTQTQVLITAKGVGDTFLTVWDRAERSLVISIHARRNMEGLRRQLKDLFPEEKIEAMSAGDLLVLSGEVSDVRIPEQVAAVAKLHAPKIANLLRVRGNQQVQLEVKFSEVTRSGLRELGVNWFHQTGDRIAGIASTNVRTGNFQNFRPDVIPGTGQTGVPAVQAMPFGNAFNLFFSGLSQFPFSAILSVLEQKNLAKALAEPTLVAMTGQEASFLAGGEFPIPIAATLGQIQVEWKKFGIQLKFQPTVLSDGLVNLKLAAEVSEIDPTLAVSLGSFTIPGLSTRRSETTVRLRDGQSFAVAGLLTDRVRSTISKIPLIGEIPILGALFRSTAYRREETELLLVVTVHLVRPTSPGEEPRLPGSEKQNDPNDFELFLIGMDSHLVGNTPARAGQAIPVPHEGGPSGKAGFERKR